MNRNEFIRKSTFLSLGLPFLPSLIGSCGPEEIKNLDFNVNFSGDVLVIGAGSAGLTAGYLLKRNNINFRILEASSDFGGRMKRVSNFADFPIDLGAEWIHEDPSILGRMLHNTSLDDSIDLITYNPQTFRLWNGKKLKKLNWASNFYSEYKFKSTSWYGFFEKYMVPQVEDHLLLNHPVASIDYSSDRVLVETESGDSFSADRVLVTVPIKILQSESIRFNPTLPSSKKEAFSKVSFGDGLKVFIEFSERFYPDILLFGGLIEALTSDSKTYYDAGFGKGSNRNILGLFSINEDANRYTRLGSDEAIITEVLAELDEIFEGKASEYYIKHVIQNWSQEPYIGGAYSYEFSGNTEKIMKQISSPLDNKLFFAGESMSVDHQATVHGASLTAYDAIKLMLES